MLSFFDQSHKDIRNRQDMNVEEEYFQAIENRDTAIMMRDEKIKAQDVQIAEQSNLLAEKDKALFASAKALKQAGYSNEQISSMTNIPVEVLNKI